MTGRMIGAALVALVGGTVLAGEFQTGMTWGFGARPGFFASAEARKDVDDMYALGVRWIVLTPNVWQEQYCSTRQFADFERSIPDYELADIIGYIHGKGMRVQLRPMLECHDGTGRLGVIVGDDWERISGKPRGYCRKWFAAMRARSVWYARLAERTKCEMYCLDSEFDRFIGKNAEWKSVVAAVRQVYSGPITNSHTIHCDVFDWEKVTADANHWFRDLDVLSVSDYTPARPRGCTNELSVAEMMRNLEPHRELLRRIAKNYGKPLMFGECGCGPRRFQAASPSGCDVRRPEDAREQATYYEAFIRTFKDEPWCHGFYWWRWNDHGLSDPPPDVPVIAFSPRGPAKDVLRRYYAELNARSSAPRHVFSMSCKVTCLNGPLATEEGRAAAIAWWRENGFTKLWLESYRHGERVPDARLVEARDAFRAAGFEVCGLVTPTQLNDPPPGKKEPPMVVCWSDPKARARLREEVVRAARIFDTVIVDDFLFSDCGVRVFRGRLLPRPECERCRADKARRGISDWGAYRRALLMDVSREDIVETARRANPKAHFIVKYPCWWEDWETEGYSPAAQAELFGECWVGTETRDGFPRPLQASWIVGYANRLTGDRCGGGWYDALDCSPEKFVEQGYYTILGGAKESLVHCYDYILAKDPGRTPFGEKARASDACRKAFERCHGELRRLADFVAGAELLEARMTPSGVSEHFFLKGGKTYRARMNTTGKTVDGLAPHAFEFPQPWPAK